MSSDWKRAWNDPRVPTATGRVSGWIRNDDGAATDRITTPSKSVNVRISDCGESRWALPFFKQIVPSECCTHPCANAAAKPNQHWTVCPWVARLWCRKCWRVLWYALLSVATTTRITTLGYGLLSAWRDRRRIGFGLQRILQFFSNELLRRSGQQQEVPKTWRALPDTEQYTSPSPFSRRIEQGTRADRHPKHRRLRIPIIRLVGQTVWASPSIAPIRQVKTNPPT